MISCYDCNSDLVSEPPVKKGRVLGVLTVTLRGSVYTHTVFSWGSYGVVCPTLITSNGSARLVAQKVFDYWENPVDGMKTSWLSDCGVPDPSDGLEAFRNALIRLHYKLETDLSHC